MTVPPTPPSRPWTLVAHLDATAPKLAPVVLHDAIDLQTAAKDSSVAVVADVRHARSGSRLRGTLDLAGCVGIPLAVGVAAATGALPVAAALGALTLSYPLFEDGKTQLRRASLEQQELGEVWEGRRLLDLSNRAADAPEMPLQAPVLSQSADSKSLDAQALIAGFQRYPSQSTAVAFSGHGRAWRQLVGMDPRQAVEALKALGRPVDLLVIDACEMSNLEFLRSVAPYARYAIVAEEKLLGRGLSLSKVVTEGLAQHATAEEAGLAILAAMDHDDHVPSLSLVKLDAVEPLAQAVEALGPELQAMPRKALRQAFRDSHQFVRGLTDLSDLLQKLPPSPRVQTAQQALGQCVRHVGTDAQANGLSVQGPSSVVVNRYREATGMTAWADVLDRAQTWPQSLMAYLA